MKKTRKILRKLFKKWCYRLGLNWWKVDVYYITDPETVARKFHERDDAVCLMRTWVSWEYAEATVEVNLPALKGRTEENLEREVVHELVHVLVNEMREGKMHHEERVVTSITKAIFWTLADAEKKEGN